MKKLILALLCLAWAGAAGATPCAGCLGSCKDSQSSNCGCVHIEGCVCCGGSGDTIAAPGSGQAGQSCVKDLRGLSRCGMRAAGPMVPGGLQMKAAPARQQQR